jgi:hypothetical protein
VKHNKTTRQEHGFPGRTFLRTSLRTSPEGRDHGAQMRLSNPIHIDDGSQIFIH